MSKKNEIPQFSNEDGERAFWSKADSTDYIDWNQAQHVSLPKLKPSTKTISLRLPESMLAELKRQANKRDVPYQSLVKMYLADRLEKELKAR